MKILLKDSKSWSWSSDPFPRKKQAEKDAYDLTLGALLSLAAGTATQLEEQIDWSGKGPGEHKTYANLPAGDLIRHTVRAVKLGFSHNMYNVDGEPVLVVARERATIMDLEKGAHCPVT